jgi:hypothetical protein
MECEHMPETQKVWTDKQAKFWLCCFDIFILGWFLAVVAGIYFLMGENSREHPAHDLVYLSTLAAMFGLMLFGLTKQLSWPAARVLSAEQITDLYAKVSVCPAQLGIIQSAVKSNLTLRQRDLEFVNSLHEMHQASVSQKDAEVKRQKVLEDIKRKCLTQGLQQPD